MRINQTQRNYISEQICHQIGKALVKAGEKLTPKLFLETGYGISEKSIFNVKVYQSYNSKEWHIQVNLNNSVEWASENVCASKKEIQASILETCGELPMNWYKTQWDEGEYNIVADFPDCISNASNNPPRVKVEWPNYDRAMKTARTGYPKRITTAIQQTVEAFQTMNEYLVDSKKFVKRAQRKAMLTNTVTADILLTTLCDQAEKICE